MSNTIFSFPVNSQPYCALHEYHLICNGPHLTLKINERVVAEVSDYDPKQQDFSGILAMQLHSGPPMTVQFKDIRIKILNTNSPAEE